MFSNRGYQAADGVTVDQIRYFWIEQKLEI